MSDVDRNTDELILMLERQGYGDYRGVEEEIEEAFSFLENGNWDNTIDASDIGLPNVRIIEENEYDQSMDEDELEDLPDSIGMVGGAYVFVME